MVRDQNRLILMGLLLLGVVGMTVFHSYSSRAFPFASVNFALSPSQARAEARRIAESLGLPVDRVRTAMIFSFDRRAGFFLERSLGLVEANRLARDDISVWRWLVRWYRPPDTEEVRLALDPGGRLVGYTHLLPENASRPDVPADEARARAERFLREVARHSPSRLRLTSESSERLPRRNDRQFVWERTDLAPAGARYQLTVTVSGNEVTSFSEKLRVPDLFLDRERAEQAKGRFLVTVAGVPAFLLGMAAVVILAIGIRERALHLRFAAGGAGIIAILSLLSGLNELPIAAFAFPTESSLPSTYVQALANLFLDGILTGLSTFILLAAGEYLYRRLPGGAPPLPTLLAPSRAAQRHTSRAIVAGYAMAAIQLGYVTLFYLVGIRTFGVWAPAEIPYDNLLSTYCPWLEPLMTGLSAAVEEELLFRVIGIGLLLRWRCRPWVAVAIPGIVWSFLHSNYPQQPFFIRGVEISVVAFALGWLYLRFGLLAPLTSHYVYNAYLGSILLFQSQNWYFRLSAVGVLLLALLPLLVGLLKPRGTVEEAAPPLPEPTGEPSPASRPVEAPFPFEWFQRTFTPSLPRLRALAGIAGLGLLLLHLAVLEDRRDAGTAQAPPFLPREISTLRVTRAEAESVAARYLQEKGIDPAGFPVRVARFWFDDLSSEGKYLAKVVGKERSRELLSSETDRAYWEVAWMTPGSREEHRVEVSAGGRIQNTDHVLTEEAAGRSFTRDDAQRLAERRLLELGYDLSHLKLLEAASQELPNRRDHRFTWERDDLPAGEARFRLTAKVQGGEVIQTRRFIHLPEESRREEARQTVRGAVAEGILLIGVILFVLWALGYTLILLAREAISRSFALAAGGVLAVLDMLKRVNGIPVFFWSYSYVQTIPDYLVSRGITLATAVFMMAMVLVGVAGLTDALWRERWPELPRLAAWGEILRPSRWGLRVWGDAAIGAMCVFAVTVGLLGVLFRKNPFSETAGRLSTEPMEMLLNSWSPAGAALLNAGVLALGGILLIGFLTAALLKFGRSRLGGWLLLGGLLLLTAMLPHENGWREIVEISGGGLASAALAVWGYRVIFRRNLLTVGISFWLVGCAQGLPLLLADHPYYRANGMVVLLGMFLPLLPALLYDAPPGDLQR